MDYNALLNSQQTTLKLIEEWSSSLIEVKLSTKNVLEQHFQQQSLLAALDDKLTSNPGQQEFNLLNSFTNIRKLYSEVCELNCWMKQLFSSLNSTYSSLNRDLKSKFILECARSIDRKIREFTAEANHLSASVTSAISPPPQAVQLTPAPTHHEEVQEWLHGTPQSANSTSSSEIESMAEELEEEFARTMHQVQNRLDLDNLAEHMMERTNANVLGLSIGPNFDMNALFC